MVGIQYLSCITSSKNNRILESQQLFKVGIPTLILEDKIKLLALAKWLSQGHTADQLVHSTFEPSQNRAFKPGCGQYSTALFRSLIMKQQKLKLKNYQKFLAN